MVACGWLCRLVTSAVSCVVEHPLERAAIVGAKPDVFAEDALGGSFDVQNEAPGSCVEGVSPCCVCCCVLTGAVSCVPVDTFGRALGVA